MPDVTFRATFIDGSTARATGFLDVTGEWESEQLSTTFSFTPRDGGPPNYGWETLVGSMPDTSGTLKGVSIAGVAYRVAGDCNVKLARAYKNEAAPTSGTVVRHMTKQARVMTDIKLVLNLQEYNTLGAFTETP